MNSALLFLIVIVSFFAGFLAREGGNDGTVRWVHNGRFVPKVGATIKTRYPNMTGPVREYKCNSVIYVGTKSESGYLVQAGDLPALDLWWLE